MATQEETHVNKIVAFFLSRHPEFKQQCYIINDVVVHYEHTTAADYSQHCFQWSTGPSEHELCTVVCLQCFFWTCACWVLVLGGFEASKVTKITGAVCTLPMQPPPPPASIRFFFGDPPPPPPPAPLHKPHFKLRENQEMAQPGGGGGGDSAGPRTPTTP